ncbi:MAG: FliM/FliN family flagellar motor switch protein, partial [Thermoguttaceae bacterium]|nr:FliM/FliN family flagellar motor switch protein [Thermoguttaceae bacterium]
NESALDTLPTTGNSAQSQSVSLSKIIGAFSSPDSAINLNAIRDLQLDVRVILGEAELTLEDVMRLRKGSVVQLNAKCADPVSILVNGQLIARGEALNRNGKFCVRLTEILIK